MSRIIKTVKLDQISHWDFPQMEDSPIAPIPIFPELTGNSTPTTLFEDSQDKKLADEIHQQKQLAYAEALQEAQAKYSQEWERQLQIFQNLIKQLQDPLSLINEQLEEQLQAMLIALTQQLSKRELSIDPSLILTLIRRAIELLPISSQKIQLQISKADFDLVTKNIDPKQIEQITVEETLQPGECRVLTHSSEIDGTFDARIANLVNRIFSHDG